MSTDSTELTFVRCHSCRSLVPAVSTRCRMCGAALDAAAKAEGAVEMDPRKSGRVRQRTMSSPQAPLSTVAEEIRQAEAPMGAESAADPLGAYIEEVEIHEEELQAEVSPAEPEPANGSHAFEDESEEMMEELDAAAPLEPEPEPAPIFEPPPAVEKAPPAPQVEASKPKVILESGSRRQNRGLQFGSKPKEEAPQAAKPAFVPPMEPPAPVEPPRAEARVERQEPPPAPPVSRRTEESPSKPRVAQAEGMLCGWLVSYKTANGESVELRSGRFFVTGAPLKGNDLLLKDPSVSTPHAMASVDSGSFVVRDLMSEHGVSVKRRGQKSFERCEDEVVLEHGDWVRFGQVEYLVCLVAHVGIK